MVAARKAVARVALVGLGANATGMMRDAFRQFGIEASELKHAELQRLAREKLEGCVVQLDAQAEEVLKAARNSKSNRRVVLYGVSDDPQQALKYSKYGLNVVLRHPLERQEVIKAVRSTQLLLIHELRCYVRIPLVTEVKLEGDRRISATSQEVSGGGMSLKTETLPKLGETFDVSFELPGKRALKVTATVCWTREPASLFGIRFDAADTGRQGVKAWIDEYLEIT
jgi:hypothetical protein